MICYFSSTVLPSGRSRIVQVDLCDFPPEAPAVVHARPYCLSVRLSGAKGLGQVEVWSLARGQIKQEIAHAESGGHDAWCPS